MKLNVEEIKDNYSIQDLKNLKEILEIIYKDKCKELTKTTTTSAFSEDYINYVKINFSKSYLKSVKLSFKHLIHFFGNKKHLQSIEIIELEKFKTYLLENAPKGYLVYLRTLKAAFNVAVNWDLIQENPFTKIKFGRKVFQQPKFIDINKLNKILAKTDSQDLADIFLFAFHSGCRLGEILSLRIRNIDLVNKTITIGDYSFITKNGKSRKVPFNNTLLRILLKRCKECTNPDQHVFSKNNRFPYNKDYVSRSFKKAIRTANLDEDIHFHTLRHSFASNLAIRGVPLVTIKELLGHTSILSTQVYSHSNLNAKREAINKLSAA